MRSLEYSTPEEISQLQAEPWQIEVLGLNPDYVYWGNHEDYMSGGKGWTEPLVVQNISELMKQDDLNEVVHFYFMTERKSQACDCCAETGLNPATKKISEEWYNFENDERVCNPFRPNLSYNKNAWSNNISQVEVDALWADGRLKHDFTSIPTASEVNEWNFKGIGHDAINQHICVKARAKNSGVWGLCPECHGNGDIYISDKAHTSLQLWILHPRKGASRGVIVENIQKEDLPDILKYLQTAQQRSIERFSKVACFNTNTQVAV